MERAIKRFENLMNVSLIMVLIDILVGALLFVYFDNFNTTSNGAIIGGIMILHGLFLLIRYLYDGLGINIFKMDLIIGVASIILGIFTIINPFATLSALGVLFGIFLICIGIEKGSFGLLLRKKQDEIYPLICFISILMIIMGVVVLTNPFDAFMTAVKLAGLFLICTGLFDCMFCVLLKKRAKTIFEIFK